MSDDTRERAIDLRQRGVYALKQGNRDEARQLLGQAVRLSPQDELAWYELGNAQDDPDRQRECLKRVLAISPGHPQALQALTDLDGPPTPPPAPQPVPAPTAPQRLPEYYRNLPPSPHVYQVPRKKRRVWWWVSLFIAVVGLGALGFTALQWGPDPRVWVDATKRCKYESRDYVTAMDNVIERWDDQLKIAQGTSRIGLSAQVSQLQSIRRDALELEVPACAKRAQATGGKYMEQVIDAFLAFMAQRTDTTVSAAFQESQELQQDFIFEYSKLADRVPAE